MFDESAREVKERLFAPIARPFRRYSPMLLSLIGVGFGVAAAVLLSQRAYGWGLLFWLLNRFFDGLDGTLARQQAQQSDLGGYIDILLDFVAYAAIPIGLVMGTGEPAHYLALAVLLGTFYVNAASWMYLSAILEKRSWGAAARAEKTSVTMPAGLIGGLETIVFYCAFILFPAWLPWLFGVMIGLTLLTIGQRLAWAVRHLA